MYLQAGTQENTFKLALTVLFVKDFTNFSKVNNLMFSSLYVHLHWGASLTHNCILRKLTE